MRNLIASDSFAYSDGFLDTVASGIWDELNAVGGRLSTIGGLFKCDYSGDGVARRSTGTYTGDHYSKTKLVTIGGGGGSSSVYIGVTVRCSADTGSNRDYYGAVVVDAVGKPTRLYKITGGASTTLSEVTGDGWVANDTISLEAIQNGANVDLKIYRNDVLLRTITDSSSPLPGANSRPGIVARGAFHRGDDWEGGSVTASSGTPYVLTADPFTVSAAVADATLSYTTGGDQYTLNADSWTAGAAFEEGMRDYEGFAAPFTVGATFADASGDFGRAPVGFVLAADPFTVGANFNEASLIKANPSERKARKVLTRFNPVGVLRKRMYR